MVVVLGGGVWSGQWVVVVVVVLGGVVWSGQWVVVCGCSFGWWL